ncbi:MAG: undecaprenyl-phosphate glucose phosphotransferase [Mucilaginibacter sp.]|nr:undecaprenyl-phosphate glucose phosphotransferase [Mucilaginibacter sp.]
MNQNRALKRLFDIFFSLGVIIFILSWLLPLLVIMIKIESRGPGIFKQERSGRNNKPFWCYKFRSMRVNNISKQATKGDIRTTRIGAFMRRTSLDELPQFFNVLLGEMSVVGPRPHMLKQTEEFSRVIYQYMDRHFLRPGITGWAQVNGYRGEIKDHNQLLKRFEYDMWYIENWTNTFDIKIILKTFINVIKGDKNAY